LLRSKNLNKSCERTSVFSLKEILLCIIWSHWN